MSPVCSPAVGELGAGWKQAREAKCPSLQRGKCLDRKDVLSPRLHSVLVVASACFRGDAGFVIWWDFGIVKALKKKKKEKFAIHASILRTPILFNLRNQFPFIL